MLIKWQQDNYCKKIMGMKNKILRRWFKWQDIVKIVDFIWEKNV